jgi:hypothetical protein
LPTASQSSTLLTTPFALLEAHRPAFGQARPYRRASDLLVGWLLTADRQIVTRLLPTLGLG